jgi:hypothetical protein
MLLELVFLITTTVNGILSNARSGMVKLYDAH